MTNAERLQKLRTAATNPSAGLEVFIWIFIAAATVGMRLYAHDLVPAYIWTRDSQSYAGHVFQWLDGRGWITDGRRGPVYSVFLALSIKLGGSMLSVVWFQHLLGALAVLSAAFVARLYFGRTAIVPLGFCAAAFGIYSLPITLEQLIRNETILFFTGTLALVGWALFLKSRRAGWLLLSGVSVGLLTLTKNIYVPFVPVVCVLLVWLYLRQPLTLLKCLACFVVAAASPFVANKVLNAQFAQRIEPPQPQDGILFYGRTAQFTKLDGGLRPDLKAVISADVIEYRQRKKLDNNWIIYRSVVPKIRQIFREEHKSGVELNRFCRQLAVEAIREHPAEYARQVGHDFFALLFNYGRAPRSPNASDVKSGIAKLKIIPNPHWSLHAPETLAALEQAKNPRSFKHYARVTQCAWLFALAPVFLTSLFLPVWIWLSKPEERLFWLAIASVWYFNLVLLSSVGRPLSRYLIPVTPIMFWTLTAVIVWLWHRFVVERAATKNAEPNAV